MIFVIFIKSVKYGGINGRIIHKKSHGKKFGANFFFPQFPDPYSILVLRWN